MTRTLANAVLRVGAAVFVGVGAWGILTGAFEWDLVDVGLGDTATDATFAGQQRFLKALELSVGLVILHLRHAALTDARTWRLVTAVFALTPAARGLGVLLDGWPAPLFVGVWSAELLALGVLLAHGASAGFLVAPRRPPARGRLGSEVA